MPKPINANDDYGVTEGSSSDQTNAMQNAIDAAQAAQVPLILDAGTYRFDGTLFVKQGRGSGDPFHYEFDFDAQGSVFLHYGSGPLIHVSPQCPRAQVNTGMQSGSVSMRRFTIQGENADPGAVGVKLGRSGYGMYDFFRANLLEDVGIFEVPGVALEITNAAHFNCERVTCRTHFNGGSGLYLHTDDDQPTFTGDCSFIECQWQADASSDQRAVIVGVYNKHADTAELRGVRFISNVSYDGPMWITSNGENGMAKIADIWLENCAFDTTRNAKEAIIMESQGNGSPGVLNKIFVTDVYIVGFQTRGIRLQGFGANRDTSEIVIKGGSIGNTNEPVWAQDFNEFQISEMNFYDTTGWSCINSGPGCVGYKINDNRAGRCNNSWMVTVAGPNNERYQVTDNLAFDGTSGFKDDTGGVSKSVHNNVAL